MIELPEPERWNFDDFGRKGTPAYSTAQMQSILEQGIAYGREQMREECVKLVDAPIWITWDVRAKLITLIRKLS